MSRGGQAQIEGIRQVHPLVFSHIAIASSVGIGIDATVEALVNRRSGLTPCGFETADLKTCIGQVPDDKLAPVRDDLADFDCRNNRLAQLALAQDAFDQAVIEAREQYGASRVGVFIGTSTSGIHSTELAYRRRDPDTGALPPDFHYAQTHNTYSVSSFVQSFFALCGPSVVVSSACSSSANAFGTAARMIAIGACDAALVGGVDSLCLTTLYGFGSLGLLSPTVCRPFDAMRDGISIGEGAGFVLLERANARTPAGAIALLGCGASADAYHMSSPHPEGLGARLAMERALRNAGLEADAIEYINLHGTGTQVNDVTEGKAVTELFGSNTRCSSTKGWTGHTLGACGAIDAIISALAIERKFLPGSVNTQVVDPTMKLRYLLDNETVAVDTVMSNAFGFGGTNCSLIIGRVSQ